MEWSDHVLQVLWFPPTVWNCAHYFVQRVSQWPWWGISGNSQIDIDFTKILGAFFAVHGSQTNLCACVTKQVRWLRSKDSIPEITWEMYFFLRMIMMMTTLSCECALLIVIIIVWGKKTQFTARTGCILNIFQQHTNRNAGGELQIEGRYIVLTRWWENVVFHILNLWAQLLTSIFR